MKQTEIILGGLVALLMLIRLIVPFPFSALAITFSSLFLALLYFVFSFALLNGIRLRHVFKSESYKGISTFRLLGTIFAGFVFSITVIYCLFKFQRWPYGNEGLLISLNGIIFIAVAAVLKYATSKGTFYKRLFIRALILGIFTTALYLVSYETILEVKNRDYPDYVEAEKKAMRDPQNRELQQKAMEERQKMDLDN